MKKKQTSMPTPITLVVLTTVLSLSTRADSVVPCGDASAGIFCEHGSECVLGTANFADYELPGGNFHDIHQTTHTHHCACTDGWTGVDCSVSVQSCASGVHFCLHGGECVVDQNNYDPYCDCSDAVDEFGSRYVGKWCEHKEQGHCNQDKFAFCLNGGTCNDEYPESGEPCNCVPPFDGPHCEYEDIEKLPDCEIDCQNGGLCKLGDGVETDYVGEFVEGYYDSQGENGGYADTFYCECPPEWTGYDCSIPVENCADGQHFCLHGGACIVGDTADYVAYCDCSSAVDENERRYVGRWCQHEEKLHCEDNFTFCLNGGKCNNLYRENAALPCECKDGFFGPHCEFEAKDNLPTCTLDCENGGICKLGKGVNDDDFQAYLGDVGTPEDMMYCECPKGFHGDHCEVSSVACGENGEDRCYHGSTCVTREVGGQTQYHCDCNTAGDGKTKYAGNFCQYKATATCTDGESLMGELFCVNGGICQPDPSMGCKCHEGFRGFSCEFNVGNHTNATSPDTDELPPGVDTYSSSLCNLDCGANGFCRNGIKDISNLGDAAYAEHLNVTHLDDFEHCVCKEGFVGVKCEHQVEECGGVDDHFCLHGSMCVLDGDHSKCDCSTANDTIGVFFAGKHCEHPSTSVCAQKSPDDTSETESFCTNHGTCKAIVSDGEAHAGCNCQTGWTGQFCEKYAALEHEQSSSARKGAKVAILVILFAAIAVVGLTIALRFMSRRRYRKESSTELDWNTTTYQDNPDQTTNLSPLDETKYSSSRDPMAFLGKKEEEAESTVFLGPPNDDEVNNLDKVNVV